MYLGLLGSAGSIGRVWGPMMTGAAMAHDKYVGYAASASPWSPPLFAVVTDIPPYGWRLGH